MNPALISSRRWPAIWLLTALAYVALGKVSIDLGTLVGTASPFWLPAGLITATALRYGYRLLPGIFLGQVLVGILFSSGPVWPYLLMACGNLAEGAAIAYFCPRLMRGDDLFASVRNFFIFFAAALVGSGANALLGTSALLLAGSIPLPVFSNVMLDWSIGDLGGTLIVAPLLLSLRHFDRSEWRGLRLVEFLLVLLVSCAFAYAIFSDFTRLPAAPLAFVLLPCLLWTAFRFGPVSCSVNNAVLMALVIWGTTHGRGPFVVARPTDALVLLQLFTSVLIVTALLTLIVNRDRLKMTEELRDEAARLDVKVKERTTELLQATIAAEAASRAKSEFLSSMSHELRTPLNAILGFSQLFATDTRISSETREHATEIVRAGEHLLALVNDLIDLARIENGRMEFTIAPVSARAVIDESVSMTHAFALRHGITVVPQLDACGDAMLLADRSRLCQVLTNLISNAIKYNRPQGTVTITCAPAASALRISVVDTGSGIPLESRHRIFNAFDRLGREGGVIEGTGIGLVICKRIIKALNGRIGFDSVDGRGTTFWVELPLASQTALPLVTETTVATQTPAPSSDGHVLLAEDNLVNQRLTVAMLNKLGYSVDVVDNGLKAVTAARDDRYGLILMDCQMPEMDGYQATAAIRKDERRSGRHLPIIAITANAMEGDRERCLAAGMDDYLSKPVNLVQLKAALTTWLRHPA